ncbi:DUF3857 domain-containing protein [Flavihumibacter sp. CACIAM 22H1]|uniref:DUF3857 domain-containing protein n=1 Tax=Flavihumibacter sp. CACIAM 22H1 TaxID=1812911 RepID=UPI0007A8BBF3|nr:DUF3857 domain-containing protein [Flavihumibacter sp. CACIAM 22H1]KYP16261.1 MAG: hypothetical protein A1D16_20170 [Flavihumibacter sp. CACIAM 22H1]
MLTELKKLVTFLLLLIQLTVYSQNAPSIERENWTGSATVQRIPAKYNKESAVILLDKRRIEYIDDAQELAAYRTLHRRIHIIDDNGIEQFNKIYLPVNSNNDIVDIKARTILPNGKVITVDSKNIRDLKEDDQLYKIFAMEALEKGCDVEFYYTYRIDGSFFGREIIQTGFPVLEAEVAILSPERLIFETKGYNQVNAAIDTMFNTKRMILLKQEDIPGAEKEKYAVYNAHLKRIEYKLSYNVSRSKTERLFTWNELAKRAYSIYGTYSDKDIKRVNELIKKNDWQKITANEQSIVVAVENYLKKNIGTSEYSNDKSAEDIEMIIKKKISSHRGIMRLYGAIFRQLNLEHEFVLCGSREDYAVDKNFENWNNCDNLLIYFPALKKYIAPTRLEMRYPLIQTEWIGTNGVFCKGTTIGNFTTAIADIRPIVGEDCNWSSNNIDAKINLNFSLDSLMVHTRQSYTGYSAVFYRASFNFAPDEQQQVLIKEMAKFGTKSEKVLHSKVENKEMEQVAANKPFVLDLVVNASELVDRAGNKILVKIGEIIGQQSEMYQEKPRQFDIDVNYPHTLNRHIEFTIPDGYKVKNLEDINISKQVQDNNMVTMGFTSSYKLDGKLLKISIREEYCQLEYPLAQYEAFKKIINAAADFNKIILVLEPQ